MTEEGFWDFANQLYAQPGVADACLWLQDQRDLDVMVMLFCLWAGHRQGALDQAALQQLCAANEPLRRTVITPLRAARRWLKQQNGNGNSDRTVATLYTAIKANELLAEQLQAQRLEQHLNAGDWAVTPVSGPVAASANLQSYFTLAGTLLDQQVIHYRNMLLSAAKDCAAP
jgi:uncharacterized protein (TIGR02444 family)